MFASSKIYMLKPYFQCEDTERVRPWEVIRSWGQASQNGISDQERSLPLMRIQWDNGWQWKCKPRHWICWCLELELPKAVLRLAENRLFFFFFWVTEFFSILIYYMLCQKETKTVPIISSYTTEKSPRTLNGSTDSHLRPCGTPL